MSVSLPTQIHPATGWQACLTLGFTPTAAGKTLLAYHEHRGPLLVQRPFYPELGGVCHVYVLHPPGGLVGGDSLTLEAELEPGAHALLTTPAAGKCYRSSGPTARQIQVLKVRPGAVLEWLPQENILFAGARVRTKTQVELHGDARFMGWEILCLGRPAAGETFTRGSCRQWLGISRDGVPLYLEHGRYEGGSELLQASWGLGGMPVTGTLLCSGASPALTGAVRKEIDTTGDDELFGITLVEDILVCRYQGPSALQARTLFGHAWTLLRPALLGIPACPPRVWNT